MKLLERVDEFQQQRPWAGFPLAVYRKFSDDQAGNLAALLAYYAFFSIFPLLLVLVTVLGFVLQSDAALQTKVFDTTLGLIPIIGQHSAVHPLRGNVFALVIGAVLALWSGLGVAQQAQNAFNTIHNVPRKEWPGFAPRVLRSVLAVVLGGGGFIVTTLISGVITGAGSYGLSLGVGLRVVGAVVAIVLNAVIFTLLFRSLTVRDLSWRDTLPGGCVAAVGWYVLQLVGTGLVAHKLKGAESTYGTFATVIGLLFFFHLQAQITLYAAEINVVRGGRLWPRGLRSFVNDPTTEADYRAYVLYAERERFAAADQQEIRVHFDPEAPQPDGYQVPGDSPAGGSTNNPSGGQPSGDQPSGGQPST